MDSPYQNPYNEYRIEGQVLDSETGKPVCGVAVTLLEAMAGYGGANEMGSKIDSLEVAQDGTFYLAGRSYYGFYGYKFLRVTDLDKEFQGNYKTEVFEIELEFEKAPPANSTYSQGTYANRNVVLEINPL